MIGQTLGPYRVLDKLGEGGMGAVYRAHDSRLNRDVAMKVLPDLFAHDHDRLARFTREAQALAALNHPNIAQIYGIEDAGGSPALVMEYIDGQTLADKVRLAAGSADSARIPADDVTTIALEIARGLEAAHEKGIIHRDLKPANVKLTADGHVKILDFGLAKALSSDPTASHAMNSPTLTARATEAGLILGTAAYMSPEQARGKSVDKRTDIWAFGAVLFELLTGERAFPGETVSDTLVSVLKTDPEWNRLPADTPPRLRRLLERCLERDPARRLRDIGEARIALESTGDIGLSAPPASSATITGRVPVYRRPLPWMVATALLAIATAGLWLMRQAPVAAALELNIAAPETADFQIGANLGGVVISPDGARVAFIAATQQSPPMVWIRSLAADDARALPKTEGASYPFWAPDSRRLAFFAGGKLRAIDITSGLPDVIADAPAGRGGSWGEDGTIVFTPNGGESVFRVAAAGGQVQQVTKVDPTRGENAHYWPVHLPGDQTFIYFVRSTIPENNGVYVARVDGSGTPVRVISALSSALYAPSPGGGPGHLLWAREGDLLAQPFDPASNALVGTAAPIASHVLVQESQRALFASVSRTGVLAWADARAAEVELVLFDRNGRRLSGLPVSGGNLYQPTFSPDGSKLLFMRALGGTADVWMHDLAAGTTRQVTTHPDYDESASWSPDGKQMAHVGRDRGRPAIVITALDGVAPPTVTGRESDAGLVWTPDGRFLLFGMLGSGTGVDPWAMPLGKPDDAVPLNTDPESEAPFDISPDGRWVAMTSLGSGAPRFYLTRFVVENGKPRFGSQRLPVDGVSALYWRREGREIVALSVQRRLVSIPVTENGDALTLGKPVELFAMPGSWAGSWAASPDAMRFVLADAPRAARQSLRVLTNWESRLEK